MKRIVTIVLAASPFLYAASTLPTIANVSDNEKQLQADIDAIHKDNEALRRDLDKLEMDRAAKANAKASGSYGKEAADSVAIGVDKTAIQEKKVEKKVDQKILEHHENQSGEDLDSTAKPIAPSGQ